MTIRPKKPLESKPETVIAQRQTPIFSKAFAWKCVWKRRALNLGFMRILRFRPVSIPNYISKKTESKKWIKPLLHKALTFFATFPVSKTRFQRKAFISAASTFPKPPIYYIYRDVSAGTPYKYNLGFLGSATSIVGGAA